MKLQFIQDNQGNTTGVYIPIEDWQSLKTQYTDFETRQEETKNEINLVQWQKQVIDERLNDYYKNSNDITDFDATVDDIEKSL